MPLSKNKKRQFYIFMAILLIAYAFNIARPSPLAVDKPGIFKELYENTLWESFISAKCYRG